MGIFDRFFSIGSSDEALLNSVVKETRNDSKLKFKETLNVNDEIIDMYKDKHSEDIQQEILSKYLKQTQDEISLKLVEENEIKEEVDEVEGLDKKEKEELAKQVEEEREEDRKKGKKEDTKDRKKALKQRVYQTAYKNMYKDYTDKVLNAKNAQLVAGAAALSEYQAVELLAYEKNLEKMELMYVNVAGKNFTQNKEITKQREEFKEKFDYSQNGIDNKNEHINAKLNMLYAKREQKYREYINALTDKSKTPQEVALYKKEYEEANLKLIHNIPSLGEYTKQLGVQEKSEELVKEAGLEGKSAVNERISYTDPQKARSVTDGKTAELLEHTEENQRRREAITDYRTTAMRRTEYAKGEYENAIELSNAKELNTELSSHVEGQKIGRVEYKSDINAARRTMRESDKEEKQLDDREFNDFRQSLGNLSKDTENMSVEDAQELMDNEVKYQEEEYEERRRKEAQKESIETEQIIRRKNNSNHNN